MSSLLLFYMKVIMKRISGLRFPEMLRVFHKLNAAGKKKKSLVSKLANNQTWEDFFFFFFE